MSLVQKFMFDRTFDGKEPGAGGDADAAAIVAGAMGAGAESALEEEAAVVEQEEEEIKPSYSEEQLAAAKKEAFEAGKQEGTQEAGKTVEQQTLVAMESVVQHLDGLFAKQEDANTMLVRDGVGVSATIVRKLFPAMDGACGPGEIERLIEHTLLRLIVEPRVVIKINPVQVKPLETRLDELKSGAGYEGRIVLKEDAAMPKGDCRIEWGDGSAERNVATLWQSIDDIVESNIGKVVAGIAGDIGDAGDTGDTVIDLVAEEDSVENSTDAGTGDGDTPVTAAEQAGE